MKVLTRLLYQVHRWGGVVLALCMFIWLFSGLVIIYSTPATQTRSQQFAHAETLAPEAGWLSLGKVWQLSAEQRKAEAAARKTKPAAEAKGEAGIADARLARIAGEPLWLIEDTRGLRFAISALDGSLHRTSPELALKIAANWVGGAQPVSFIDTLDKPGLLRNQEALSPFHHIGVGDSGEELLISARTGEVLHDSTRVDRAFYYAGNWLHFFRVMDSVGLADARRDTLTWLGLVAAIASLTGLVIGWLRWRPGFRGKPTYSQGRTQPYREAWSRWHFWSGLLGGTVALSWAFSGFIDINTWHLLPHENPNRAELARYQGGELPASMRDWQPAPFAAGEQALQIVELGWRRLGDEATQLAYTREGERLPQAVDAGVLRFSDAALLAGIQRLSNNARIASQSLQTDYDSYYYPRHHQGPLEKPLPVQVVRLADEAGTQFYLDPQDGRLLLRQDNSSRAFRWLYSALHHWDFGWFYYRPFWDVWMLTWVSFGLVLGGSSVVLGWRRLRQTFRIKKTSARKAAAGRELLAER